jgi:hypothetical protein
MSIRLWLMVADCWRCGTSIELTEEQEQEARRLLKQQESSPTKAPVAPPPPSKPVASHPAKSVAPPPPVKPYALPAKPLPPPPAIVPRRGVAGQDRHRQRVRELQSQTEVDLLLRSLFRDLPAWLASLVVHLVLLIALSVWLIEPLEDKNRPLSIVLSTRTADPRQEGGAIEPPQPEPVEFEKRGDDEKIENKPEEEQQEPTAPEEPPEPEPDPAPKRGDQPEPPPVFAGRPGRASVGPALVAGRRATARRELVKQEGGTTATEAAVARGLEWLARHQNKDGSWSLHKFSSAGGCNGRCDHRGMNSDVAGTALALLPFLGAGQTHLQGQYKDEVRQGLRWLIARQLPDGDIPSAMANSHMYAHGQAAIALCEACALTRDEFLREPAQRAIDFIVDAQHSAGGWRYQPHDRGDTSVVGWQIMALRSAQMAYLSVPPQTFVKAGLFLDSVQTDSAGGRYAYMPGNRESYVMTAEALLCRQYGGWPQNHPGLVDGVRFLLADHLPRNNERVNMYYVYYATQVMHHMGGDAWSTWNYQVRDILVDTQETKGHQAGSWTPVVGHDESGGRLYMTALAVCTLEVYYRHMPLYRQAAVEKQ